MWRERKRHSGQRHTCFHPVLRAWRGSDRARGNICGQSLVLITTSAHPSRHYALPSMRQFNPSIRLYRHLPCVIVFTHPQYKVHFVMYCLPIKRTKLVSWLNYAIKNYVSFSLLNVYQCAHLSATSLHGICVASCSVRCGKVPQFIFLTSLFVTFQQNLLIRTFRSI